MIGVLRRTVVCDWRFDNLVRRPSPDSSDSKWRWLLQSQVASAQVVPTSITNSSPSQDSNHQNDIFQSRYSWLQTIFINRSRCFLVFFDYLDQWIIQAIFNLKGKKKTQERLHIKWKKIDILFVWSFRFRISRLFPQNCLERRPKQLIDKTALENRRLASTQTKLLRKAIIHWWKYNPERS